MKNEDEKAVNTEQYTSRFLTDLECFLSVCTPSAKDVEPARGLIYRAAHSTEFAGSKCLKCGCKVPQWKKLSRLKNPDWLAQGAYTFHDGKILYGKYHGSTTFESLQPFLCDACSAEIKAKADDSRVRGKKEKARSEEYWDSRKILGKTPCTPGARMAALQRRTSDEQCRQLRDMPYPQFLRTIFWDIVRKYVLHRYGYQCALCPSKTRLNVHHRSYAFHGYECYHTEDLIVLCRECHATHHDMLDEPNEE